MKGNRRTSLDLTSLLLGLVFGVGTNLLTADPDGWWGPLRAVNRYALVWLPVGVTAVVAWELGLRWRERRRVPWTRDDSPYPGLEAFAEDRADVFFGREDEIRDAVRALTAARSAAQRVLTVVGPSGCGKSSFVAAGVLPELRRRRWAVLGPLRLGSSPFLALAQALTPRAAQRQDDTVVRLARELRQEAADGGVLTVCLAALRAAQGHRARIVLAIDQFEDIVRMTSPAERELFLGALRALVHAHPQLHLVLTLPSAFLHDPAPVRYDDLLRTRFPLGTLTSRQTRAVIAGPARAAGADIAEGVVDDLVVEATEGDALPLLGQLLRDLYEAAGPDHVIGRELLTRTGPLSQAIARYAEGTYARLVAEHPEELLESVLLRFVAWDERGFARQSVRRPSLDAAGLAVVEDLRQARLVTDVDEGEAFDLVHEALLRHWPRLHELTERHRDVLRRSTDLERRAAAWLANDRSADDLLHGQRLAQARELAGSHGVSAALAELVAASRAREEATAEERADDLAERAQQAYALRGERQLALALTAAAVREYTATEKVALTLWGIGHGPVVDSLGLGHAGTVLALGWDPGSGQLRTIGAEGDLCTWTARGDLVGQESLGPGELRGAGIGGDAYWVDTREMLAVRRFDAPEFWSATGAAGPFGDRALGLSPDGWRAAAQLANRGVDIIDFTPVPQGRLEQVRHSYEAPPTKALAWSPDCSLLALFSWNELQVVRLPDGDPAWRIVRGDDELPRTTSWFAWAPDGRRAAEASGRTLRIRAAEDGTVLDEWDTGVEAGGVFWSPDGEMVAVAVSDAGRGASAAITVWRVADHMLLRRLRTPWGAEEIAWRADSTCFAWRSSFSGVWIGDHGSWRPRPLPGGMLRSVSTEAGRVAVTVQGGDSVHVTEPGTGAGVRKLVTARDPKPVLLAWQPGADRLAVSFAGGRVEIVDPASGRCTAAMSTEYDMVGRVLWSPDGSLLATVSNDFVTATHRIEVWDPLTGSRVARTEDIERGTRVLAWGPDGRNLVTAEREGPVVVRDASTGRRLLDIPVGEGATAGAACWSPDGRRLAFLDGESAVRICGADDGAPLVRSAATYGKAAVLLWSPDGRLLATAGDGWVAFWRAETGECRAVSRLECRVPLDAHWSGDGRSFAVVGEDHRRYTWSLPDGTDTRHCEALLQRSADELRALTAEERRRYGLST
ncbi:AAA family ATPase [Streptomyces sp. NPDC001816]|uniref:nSTAND1 domain-containing NTPase n=1 Tax=Streptomyces sp. NPDC001816 TaxID=3364612 RepID=UPI00369863AB